jgi:ABC-type multidrug transport system ATPase subunit
MSKERIGYLPSISGLSSVEDKLGTGSVFRLIGQGKTADILRNVCFFLYEAEDKSQWKEFVAQIEQIFKITLNAPQHNKVNGTLSMTYNELGKKSMDISSLGSGAKQTVLLFSYLMAFPNSVNLLDEPDAHLEVIRQSNIYDKISDIAKSNNTQIIIASHSESVLERAFSRDTVISAVFGEFETLNNKKYLKSTLTTIGYEQLLIAKQKPRILYVEGTTDFDFLKAFAKKMNRPDIADFLENEVCVHPVANDINAVKQHFTTLKEFIPTLTGFAVFDNLRREINNEINQLSFAQWSRNEIENYLPLPIVIQNYVESMPFEGLLFNHKFLTQFQKIIENNTIPAALNDKNHPFWKNTKISDDYLTPIFEQFFKEIGFPRGTMDKSKYYKLVDYCDSNEIDAEVLSLLNRISEHFGSETS